MESLNNLDFLLAQQVKSGREKQEALEKMGVHIGVENPRMQRPPPQSAYRYPAPINSPGVPIPEQYIYNPTGEYIPAPNVYPEHAPTAPATHYPPAYMKHPESFPPAPSAREPAPRGPSPGNYYPPPQSMHHFYPINSYQNPAQKFNSPYNPAAPAGEHQLQHHHQPHQPHQPHHYQPHQPHYDHDTYEEARREEAEYKNIQEITPQQYLPPQGNAARRPPHIPPDEGIGINPMEEQRPMAAHSDLYSNPGGKSKHPVDPKYAHYSYAKRNPQSHQPLPQDISNTPNTQVEGSNIGNIVVNNKFDMKQLFS